MTGTNTLPVLNKLAEEFIIPIQNEYNKFVIPHKWVADANGKFSVPKYSSLESGLTKSPIENENNAFTLTPAVSGILTVEKLDSPADELVLRSYLSIGAVSQIVSAPDRELAFKQNVYPILASMLKAIEKEKGFKNTEFSLGSSYVTFDHPGLRGEFFRLVGNANAYEIRAYSDTRLLLDKSLI